MNIELERSRQIVLGEMLSRCARISPEREAIVFESTRLTYKAFDERVNKLANALAVRGVCHGDRVGVVMANCHQVAETFYALAKLGAVYVPSNFRYSAPEHVYQFDLAQIKALVFAPEFSQVVDETLKSLPWVKTTICLGGNTLVPGAFDYESLLAESEPTPPQVLVRDEDIAAIIYTSGTTGRPKGVVLTHKNILTAGLFYMISIPKSDQQEGAKIFKSLMLLPTFHISGYGAIIFALSAGQTVVISNKADPDYIMKTIQDERISAVTLVPILWSWILKHPEFGKYNLTSLLVGGTGGAMMPREVKSRIVECWPQMKMIESFGMAETCSIGTFANHDDMLARHGTVGRQAFVMDIRVVDDMGNDVLLGETGEILYRGPTVFKEYFRDTEATAASFKDGWFHSGDLVRRDDDGYFYVVGRKKDIIISGGENIASAEIEEVLRTNPQIADASVVGVPDETWGEAVKAFVILTPGATLTEAEIIEFCKERMASYKKPRFVSFIKVFPLTAGGKVKKFELKNLHEEGVKGKPA